MTYLLDLVAFNAVLCALLVITHKNPVTSVVFLIGVFINTTLYLLALGLGYLGLVYLIVYIGAIAILFLFVIMMLNLRIVEVVDTGHNFTKSLPIAAMVVTFIFYLLWVLPLASTDALDTVNDLVFSPSNPSNASEGSVLYESFNPVLSDATLLQLTQVEAIGHSIYTYGAIWLIVTAVILMLAMVGPILLCIR